MAPATWHRQVDDEALATISQASATFALDLYRELAAQSDGNLIVGPHSVWTALSMVYAGARGETAAEMADVLHFAQRSQRRVICGTITR